MSDNKQTETIRYDDAIVRKFAYATIIWGLIGMLAGLWLALELANHSFNVLPELAFGRLRPLHTNAVIFAFVGNGMGTRVVVGLFTVAVPALGMGLGFPLGLRLVQRRRELEGGPELGPWLWGINGAAGVCASGLALGSSMVWGVPATLAVGAGCYLVLLGCTWRLGR
ncbi:MAG: cbb3-type cytochrome c oxidase subunit I [Myxococcales bacterium]|nr:cbb3-type cytochrome c oxidase subunit I [Myxococcales bacterium]